MQRTLNGWSYSSDQKQIRQRRQELDLKGSALNDLLWVPGYRKLLWDYAMKCYSSDPGTSKRYRRLLAANPCLVPWAGPHPEYKSLTRIYKPWIGVKRPERVYTSKFGNKVD